MIIDFNSYKEEEEDVSADNIPVYKAPLTLGEEFKRGLGRGTEQVKALGAGLVGMAGAATGVDGVEEWGYNTAQERMQAAAAPELQGDVHSIFDIGSPGDFAHWAAGVMGEQAPNLAISVLGGGLGGALGKRVVSGAVTEALEAQTAKLVAGGLAKNVARERAKLELAEELGGSITKNLAAEKAAQLAAMKTGVGLGGAATGVGMETSSIYNDTRDLGLALKYGVPAGMIEGVADRYFGGKILDAFNPVAEAGQQVAKRSFGKALGGTAAAIGLGAVIEGPLEEVPQTRLEQMARAEKFPDYDINSEEAFRELANAGAAGSLMGSAMATGVQAAKYTLAPLTMRAQGSPEGLPDGTKPAPLSPEDQRKQEEDELNSIYNFDANTVSIDDGDSDPIEARRFNVGGKIGWAIENPTEEQKKELPAIPGGRVAITSKSKYGANIQHVLNNGGRVRKTDSVADPSLLDNKIDNEDSGYEGYDGSKLPENFFPPDLRGENLSGNQSGKEDPNLENELNLSEGRLKIATEDSVLAPHKELRNVFNAIDMLDSTADLDQQDSLIRDAVTPEELAAAKQQLTTAIAGAKEDGEITFLGDLEQKVADFENLQELKKTTAPRKTPVTPFFERDGNGTLRRVDRELSATVDDRPNKVDQNAATLLKWEETIEKKAEVEKSLKAALELKSGLQRKPDSRYEGLDIYEMAEVEGAPLEAELKALKSPDRIVAIDKQITELNKEVKKSKNENDVAAANELIATLEQQKTEDTAPRVAELERMIEETGRASSSLSEELDERDLFARTVNVKINEAENAPENKETLARLGELEDRYSNLLSEENALITDEERENFSAENKDKLKFIETKIEILRNRLVPVETKKSIYQAAAREVRNLRDASDVAKSQGESSSDFVEKEIETAKESLARLDTSVIYTNPQTGERIFGVLLTDPTTGKATNKDGNFILAPTNFRGRYYSEKSDLNDLRSVSPITEDEMDGAVGAEGGKLIDLASGRLKPIELTPAQMSGVQRDTASDFKKRAEESAKAAGVAEEVASVSTPVMNLTAAAQKLNNKIEIEERESDGKLAPVDVAKLRVGERIGFRLPGELKVAKTIYLSSGMKLVPTSAGIFRGAQTVDGDRQILFDRYYIAKPKAAKDTDHLKSLSLTQLQPGEKLITLNDLSDADKKAEGVKSGKGGVWKTSENISENLWGDVYKAPQRAVFGSVEIEKNVYGPRLTTPLARDLTSTEEVLSLAIGEFSTAPTDEQLASAGFTPSTEEAEFETKRGELKLAKVYDVVVHDPLANSGLQIPLKAGFFRDPKNPNAPLQVKAFALLQPEEMLTALRNLRAKEAAAPSQQKAGNVQIAKESLQKAVQNLKRLTLAQMNAGYDVRVPEVNGLPVTQDLESFGFTASRSGKGIKKYGKGAEAQNFGTFIITGLSISPNPDTSESEHQFTRKVQGVGQSQRQAAMTLKDETRVGRGFNNKKSGLGVGNLVLENWRAKMLDQAQAAKERQEAAITKGADLASRHAGALSRLTAFSGPIFQRYVEPIRNRVLGDAKNPTEESTPEFKERALMEMELELASILNKFQLAAMPESVAADLQNQIKTIQANAEKLRPVRFQRVSRKKDSNLGKLVDDPDQSKREFDRLTRDWKQKLARDIADKEDGFYRQLLPRTLQGKKGVTEVNKILKEIEKVKATLRAEVAAIRVKVPAKQQRVNELIDKEAENKNSALGKLNRQLANAKNKPAKERLRIQIDARKDQIAEQAATQESLTEKGVEEEMLSRVENNTEIAKLNRRLDKFGEFSPRQEALLDKFLDSVEVQAQQSNDEARVALTARLRTLLGRQKVAAEGGRRIFINVKKEDERLQAQTRKNQQRLKEKSVPAPATPKAEKKAEQLKKKIEKDIATAKKDLATAEKNLESNDPAIRQLAREGSIKAQNDVAAGEVALQEFFEMVSGAYAEDSLLTAEEAYELMKRDQLLSREEAYRKAAAKYKSDADTLIEENDQEAATGQDKIDDAIKAMDFAVVTENDRLFEGAATAFTEATQKSKAAYTQAEKNLIQAFGKMMDQVKELNIFGPSRRTADGRSIPNLVTRGFSAATEFQGAVQNSSFRDPQTGKTAAMDSELMQGILAGKADPTATQMTPEERAKEGKEKLSKEEIRDRRLEDLASSRLRTLANERFGGVGDATLPADPNLAELALVKLFGGSFNDTVNGVEINETFEPLADAYADVLFQFFARGKMPTSMPSEGKKGTRPLTDQERSEWSKETVRLERRADSILDNYLFNAGRKQVSLGVPGAPLASLPSSNSRNQAFDPRVTQSNRDATAAPSRTPAPSWDKPAVQSFVQEYTGLTDSEMVALSDAEIDAINQAATSKADAEMAINALDAVVAAKPSSETMTAGQLMRAYLDDLRAQRERGQAEVTLQGNLRLAAASKMFKSNNDFLEHIASMPRGINRATAMRAKALLAINGKGSWNWNKVATQIASFGIDGKQANWAGVAGKDASNKSGMAIYLNLDSTHQGDIVQTMLEEMDHVLTHPLIHAEEFGIQLNQVQSAARDRLRVAYKQAVLKAGEGMQDLVERAQGMTPEQKVTFYADEFLKKASENPEQFRAYYNLTSMDEFVVGVKKDPDFLELMKDLGFNEKTSEKSSLSKFIKDIFHALSELITGRKLDPNSELARIFADSWTLSAERDAQQFVVTPTQLSMALGINVASDSGSGIQGAAESVRMKNKSSNAVYNAYLEQAEDGSWSTIVEFGTPPSKLNKKALLSGATYEEAKKKFDNKIKNKADTYSIIPDKGPSGGGGSSTTTTPPKGPVSPAPKSLATAVSFLLRAAGGRSREQLRTSLNDVSRLSEGTQRLIYPISESALDIAYKLSRAGLNVERITSLESIYQFGNITVSSSSGVDVALIEKVENRVSGFEETPRIIWKRWNGWSASWRSVDLSTRDFPSRVAFDTAFNAVYGVIPDEGLRRLLFENNSAEEDGPDYYTAITRTGGFSVFTRQAQIALGTRSGGLGIWAVGPYADDAAVAEARRIYEGQPLPSPPPAIFVDLDSLGLPPSPPPTEDKMKLDTVGKVWDRLRGFEIFQFGRPLTPEVTSKILDSQGREALLEAVVDNIKNLGGGKLELTAFQTLSTKMFGPRDTFTLSFKAADGQKGSIEITQTSKNEFKIGSLGANSKGKENAGGKAMYQAAYDYIVAVNAQNKSDGLTSINKHRRTSNMFASALRHGTTKHLIPNYSQSFHSSWVNENGAGSVEDKRIAYLNNLAIMARQESKNSLEAGGYGKYSEASKKTKGWKYDFENGNFVDSNGKDVSREEFKAAVSLGDPKISGSGMATLQRAIITNTALEESDRLNGPNGFLGNLPGQRGPVNLVAYSIPGAPRVSKLLSGKSEGTTYTGQKVTTGGWFSSDANAPQGIDEIYTQSVKRKAYGEELGQTLARTLNRALTRYAKAGSPVNTDDVGLALGDIENPLNEQQAAEVNRLLLVNEEDAIVLKDEYVKANKEDFRRRQLAASARLPKDIAGIVGEMREAVDSLSAYADEKMGFSVAENLGIYLNRSFLNFGEEAVRELHRKQVRENPVVMDGLKNLLSRQLAEQDANALLKRAAREGKNLSREEAIANAQAALSPTELASAVERVLTYGDQGVGRIFMSGKIPGQKNLKILDSRGNIAPEIQAAWGIVKDPATNYVNTVLKLSALVANDKFLNDLKQIGMDTGMIYDPRNPANLSEEDAQRLTEARDAALEADPKLASRARFKPELLDRAMVAQDKVVASILEEAERKIPAGYVKLSGDTNKSLAPLSGMYAQENLAKWMFEKFPAKGEEQLWLSTLMQATFIPMAMKTVGSVSGHLRNYYAGYMSLVAGGNFNPFSEDWRRDFAAAHSMTFGRLLNNTDDASKRKAILGARARLGELGLLNQSVAQNFMGDLAKWNTTSSSGLQQGFKAFIGKVGQAYGASDEAFKLMHYFSELGKYRRAFPDMPQAALEEKAARIARDIHQTYGDTYAAVKNLKKVPFVAPFISFTSEVIRNAINLARLARSEIKEGRATGNKELTAIGINRITGMVLAGSGTFALAGLSAALVGLSGDEERDLRRLLPDWQKNSQLLFLGKSDGKIKFIDFSFTDPNSFLKQPIIAVMKELFNDDDRAFSERLMEGVIESVKTLVRPFVAPQLFTGSLVELSANRNASGRQIYNPQDNPASIAADMTWHLGKMFTPGTLDSVGRVGKAVTGFVSESGRSYDLLNEVMSFGGFRVSETDVRQSLGFKSKQFMRDYRDAASLFSNPFLSRGTQSESNIIGGYQKADESIRSLSENFREIYIGAMRLGVPQREVISILKANGISDDVIQMLRTGIIPPYQASKQALTKNREAKQEERIRGYNQAYAEAKRYQ